MPTETKPAQYRVVYFLGAGFSASLKLPLIKNFLQVAQRQFRDGKLEASLYRAVSDSIKKLSVIKNHYKTDMGNIEEVLSVLQIQAAVSANDFEAMTKFVIKVIENATSHFEPHPEGFRKEWSRNAFGKDADLGSLGLFVAGLHGVNVIPVTSKGERIKEPFISAEVALDHVEAHRIPDAPFVYSVVTTNYDMLLENASTFINKHIPIAGPLAWKRRVDDGNSSARVLAKIHGSVDEGEIVPPVSLKFISAKHSDQWKLALQALEGADHLRFVGYSLQEVDASVRYLLKTAAVEAPHWQTVDVICVDDDGSVQERYKKFFDRDVRFRTGSFRDVLLAMQNEFTRGLNPQPSTAEVLENSHEYFMRTTHTPPSMIAV